jgi:GNAT superfamily N-acetyltransferase
VDESIRTQMSMGDKIILRPLGYADQPAAKDLILAGLKEHWGWIDPTCNPDLDDLCAVYAEATCLVAQIDGVLVGTGFIVPREPGTAEIVRMSVAAVARRQGIGRRILAQLIAAAVERGFSKIILETTATWQDAVQFYLAAGFRPTHQQDGDQYFEMRLPPHT